MQRQRSVRGGIVSLIAIGVFAVIANSAQAASSNGPYYAEPAWDQKLPAATRFIVLLDWNGEAVLDRETGLVWEQSPQTTSTTWARASEACVNKTLGNRKGWRLPSIHELGSLVDPSVVSPGPTLPVGHPFTNVQSASYWSASSHAVDPAIAWIVTFSNGIVRDNSKADRNSVWCVRGGNNADAY